MDAVARRNPADQLRVVAHQPPVGHAGHEGVHGLEQQLSRRDEAAGALGKVIEVVEAVARRTRVVEVPGPRDVHEHVAERTERIPVRLRHDVTVPNGRVRCQALAKES